MLRFWKVLTRLYTCTKNPHNTTSGGSRGGGGCWVQMTHPSRSFSYLKLPLPLLNLSIFQQQSARVQAPCGPKPMKLLFQARSFQFSVDGVSTQRNDSVHAHLEICHAPEPPFATFWIRPLTMYTSVFSLFLLIL